MKEYQHIIDYQNNNSDKEIIINYANKYWINKHDYINSWKPIQDRIFRYSSKYLPDMMFQEEFELMAIGGGAIFTESDFIWLKKCMEITGDTHFAIIENIHTRPLIWSVDGTKNLSTLYRLRFPYNISWEELNNGGHISSEVFDVSIREYFVFGESCKWGKYVANEYINKDVNNAGTPLDIIGFKKEFTSLFVNTFKISEEEKEYVKECLPANYKARCLKYL